MSFKVTKHFINNVNRSEAAMLAAKFAKNEIGFAIAYTSFGQFTNRWDNSMTTHTVHHIPIRFDFNTDIVTATTLSNVDEIIMTVVFPENTTYVASLLKIGDEIEIDIKLSIINGVYIFKTLLNIYRQKGLNRDYVHAVTLPTVITTNIQTVLLY